MKIENLILTIGVSLTILGCKKHDSGENESEIKNETLKEKAIRSAINSAARNAGVIDWEDIYDELNVSTAGIFGFSTYRSFFSGYTNGRFQGSYRPGTITNGLNLTINSLNPLSPINNRDYLLFDDAATIPLYETTVNLNIGFRVGGTNYYGSKSFGLPSKLNILPDNNFNTGLGTLQNGTAISWAEDESDVDTYIIISIVFDPSEIDNGEIEGYNNTITNNLFMADKGGYSFTSDDISMFPKKAFVKINVYRVALTFGVHQQSGQEFAFGSYSCFQLSGYVNN